MCSSPLKREGTQDLIHAVPRLHRLGTSGGPPNLDGLFVIKPYIGGRARMRIPSLPGQSLLFNTGVLRPGCTNQSHLGASEAMILSSISIAAWEPVKCTFSALSRLPESEAVRVGPGILSLTGDPDVL